MNSATEPNFDETKRDKALQDDAQVGKEGK